MATYFAARKAEGVFNRYKALVFAYWSAMPKDDRTWVGHLDRNPALESTESLTLRRQVIRLFPEVDACVAELGISVTAHSYPAPAVGGPILPVNVLYAAVDPDQGHSTLPRRDVIDMLEHCIATATRLRKKLFWAQVLNPVWWVTEVVAYIIRIPFMVLRKAGLPASVEESIWGHVMKVAIFVLLVLASLHWGLKITAKDILQFIK